MKNSVIRLIGLFALISGGITLFRILSIATYSPLSINAISEIIFAWVALYGGYQTIRFRPIGRRLLLIFFSSQIILTIIFIFFILILGTVLIITNRLIYNPSSPEMPTLESIITASYFILCIPSLIFLVRKDVTNCFPPEKDHHHIEVVGKTLAFVAPGLGRALVGNYWKGTLIYFVCFVSVAGLNIMSNGEISLLPKTYWPLIGFLTNFSVKLAIWFLFFQNDWAFVNNALKHVEIVSPPAKALSSEQSSG